MRALRLALACATLTTAFGTTAFAASAAAPAEPPRSRAAHTVAPEADAAAVTAIPLVNPGFESADAQTDGAPAGWLAAQHAGELSYTFKLDDASPRRGRYSARIDNVGEQPFGIMYQLLAATTHIGKRLRFSADVRTRGAGNDESFSGAVLVVQAMQSGAPLAVERMADRALRGDNAWQRHSVELVIPPGTQQVQVGVMLMGKGTAWVDDAELASVAEH